MTPAKLRKMQYTCVIERPELQSHMLDSLASLNTPVINGARVKTYEEHDHGVRVSLESGEELEGP